jgi:phage tail sheath protein FI
MNMKWKTPGVQIEEVSLLPTTIVRDSVTMPLFIGYTLNHHGATGFNMGSTIPTRALRIGSFPEFVQVFGGLEFLVMLNETLDGAGKVTSHKVELVPNRLLFAMQHYFANGGGPCMVISCSNLGFGLAPSLFVNGMQEAESVHGCSLLVMPEMAALDGPGYKTVAAEALAHTQKVGNRFVILDAPDTGSPQTDANAFRANIIGANLRNGAAYYPYLATNLKPNLALSAIYISHTTTQGTSKANGKFNWSKVSALNPVDDKVYLDEIQALLQPYDANLILPPSAAVAGQIVRNDRDRGLWKAPANISLNAVVGPKTELTQIELDNFNVDAENGKSINVIRSFQGRGTLIWGARTLDGNSPEWRYVPVRRLFTMAENAIKRGCEWAVFEPNDSNTWLRLKSMIEIYLTSLWRDGALLGGKPQDAFYVRVGLGVTMTPQDIMEGILRIEIGMAAVRPAEFIVLRVSQMMQQS